MPAQSISQKYSEIVFARVQKNVASCGDSKALRQYKGLCKRSGGVLRTIGLIQYLAFLKAKASKYAHYKMLLEDLAEESKPGCGVDPFLESVRKMNLGDYMQYTRLVLTLLQWHKRVSDILIEGNCETDGDD
ncbi:MAG: hypothetical protein MJY98_08530 [Fibrobacter sp.]|nr:hypothetical protein [Fibrobacter sp.]